MGRLLENIAISFLASFVFAWLIIKTDVYHRVLSHDHDTKGIQKFHSVAVPRIGGIAFLVGLACGGMYFGLKDDNILTLAKWAGIAVLPVFLGGLFEDVTKNVTPRDRLLLAFLSAAIAYYELDVGLLRVGWIWFDESVMVFPGISLVLTMLMVGGVSQAANVIDGFHGLLMGIAILALIALSQVAHIAGNDWLALYMSIMIGSLLGVFAFNYPNGKIFLGDGGAYLVGFLLAVFGLLVVRNEKVSPWCPLLILIYPVFETLFSIYRKKVMRGRSAMSPDRLHLHMLVYHRVLSRTDFKSQTNRNAATGAIMWLIGGLPMIPAVVWWDNATVLVFSIFLYCAGYLTLYFWIIRYKLQHIKWFIN
jgi:UDP-N-acetylmuramyl pentapeptide phosphotransferase/UDP-N-acetylglucosamine-1-phosphate transferase